MTTLVSTARPEITVVVPTCGRPALLGRCLEALLAQSLDPSRFELIVVDDGCCDETAAQVACVADRGCHRVRYLRTAGRRGPAAARNLGWRLARGPAIAFTDDDCLPEPGWLAAGLGALRQGADGASGKVRVPMPARPTDHQRNYSGLERSLFVTASCFYRRAALEASGGFDERFTRAWREDSDLFFELLGRGLRLVEAPEAVVLHPARPAPWGVSLRLQRNAMYSALLYKKHPALYRRYLGPVRPWPYYAILAALLLGAAGALAGRRRLGRAGLLAWALLSGRFCARRLAGTSRSAGHLAEIALTSALIPPLALFWRAVGSLRYRVVFF